MIGGGGSNDGHWIGLLARPLAAFASSPFVSQDMGMRLAQLNPEDLKVLVELIQAGKVTPVIDRTYPLSEAPAAIRYLEEGHARGKVIISVD